MNSADGSTFLAAAIVFGVGILVVVWGFNRLFRRASAPRDVIRFRDELERRAVECLHADMEAAEKKMLLMEMVGGPLPEHFDPGVFLGLKVAAGVQRALLVEAERKGLVRVGTFERVYGVTIDQAFAVAPAPATPAAPATVDVPAEAPPAMPLVEFAGGKIVPREAP